MEQKVNSLLVKEAIEFVPPPERETLGFTASISWVGGLHIWGLVCHNRSQRHILLHIHSSTSQEIPQVHFWGRSVPVSDSSFRPSLVTPHLDKVHRSSSGLAVTPGHPDDGCWWMLLSRFQVQEVLPGVSGHVYFSRNITLTSLVLPYASSPTGFGCHGTDRGRDCIYTHFPISSY